MNAAHSGNPSDGKTLPAVQLGSVAEQYYHALFDCLPDGVYISDDAGYCLDVNATLARMLGYTRDEMLGIHARNVVDHSQGAHIAPVLEEVAAKGTHRGEWMLRRKDGSLFNVEIVISCMPNGNQMGIVRDITERRHNDAVSLRLAAIVESSFDAIISTDLESIITSWNHGAENLFGYRAGEIVGSSIKELIPPGQQDEENQIVEAVRHGNKIEYVDTVRQTKDGRLVNVSITASPIRDALGNIVGTSKIMHDISVLKSREVEISRLSRLFDALGQISQAIVRLETRRELFQKVCQILVEQGGFRMAWIGWLDVETQRLVPVADWGDESGYSKNTKVYVDDRPEGRGPSGQAFRSARPYICSDMPNDPAMAPWRTEILKHGFRASAVIPIREGGMVCGTLNVYSIEPQTFLNREITLLEKAGDDVSFALDKLSSEEMRRRVEDIALSERMLSDIMIENMPGILYFCNDKGQLLRWNRNFEVVMGYSQEEILRMHALDFFPEEEKALIAGKIAEVFETGISFSEAAILPKHGKPILYFLTGSRAIFNGVPCLVGMGIDISERKRAEAALQHLNETLEQKVATRTQELQSALVRAESADKLKSAFLATMSHELRTPLNAIIGFTGIVHEGLVGPLNPEQTKQLGMVKDSAYHLLDLINDVLDISKIEAGQFEIRAETFDLNDMIKRVIASMQPVAEKKGLLLATSIASSLGSMVSDRRRVEQILINLLNNAVKFTEKGSVMLVAKLIDDYRPAPEAAMCPAARFQIIDTGIGIKADDLGVLFQPFRQIDASATRQHEGTGLGLAICRRLASLLGGEIAVVSTWASGSEFTVTLPLNPRKKT